MASFLEYFMSSAPGTVSETEERKNIREQQSFQETAMENRWKSLHGRPGPNRDSIVFYKDMRFWLIVLMLAAFFAFTLVRFP